MWSGFVGSFSKDCGFVVIAIYFKRAEECSQNENTKTDGGASGAGGSRTEIVKLVYNID